MPGTVRETEVTESCLCRVTQENRGSGPQRAVTKQAEA